MSQRKRERGREKGERRETDTQRDRQTDRQERETEKEKLYTESSKVDPLVNDQLTERPYAFFFFFTPLPFFLTLHIS